MARMLRKFNADSYLRYFLEQLPSATRERYNQPPKMQCEYSKSHERRLQRLVPAALLILSLALSVSTRFVHFYEAYHTDSKASSYSPQSKRQDLEKDAVQWTPPRAAFAYLPPPSFEQVIYEDVGSAHRPILDARMFNRPPPSC